MEKETQLDRLKSELHTCEVELQAWNDGTTAQRIDPKTKMLVDSELETAERKRRVREKITFIRARIETLDRQAGQD